MPQPSEQALVAYLNLYPKYRDKLSKEKLKNVGKQILAPFTSFFETNVDICEKLKKEINTAVNSQSADTWFDLVFKLITQANESQSSTSPTFSNERSILCATGYGLANLIVRYMCDTRTGDDEVCVAFRNKIAHLVDEKNRIEALIDYRREHENSRGVPGLKIERDKLILQLAYLGDRASLTKAMEYKLFTHLDKFILKTDECDNFQSEHDVDVDHELPYCVQQNSFEIVFYMFYHRFEKKTPYEFVDECIKSESDIKAMNALRQQRKKQQPSLPIPLPLPRSSQTYLLPIDDKELFGEENQQVPAQNQQPESMQAPDENSTQQTSQEDTEKGKEKEKQPQQTVITEETLEKNKANLQSNDKPISVVPNSIFNPPVPDPSSLAQGEHAQVDMKKKLAEDKNPKSDKQPAQLVTKRK